MAVSQVTGTHPHRPVAILDDDDAFREALADGVASLGYATAHFAAPADLYAYLDDASPLCLLLDYNLPGITGLHVQARLARSSPELPVVFLTASDDDRICRAAFGAGAIAFLTKPVRLVQVEELIVSLVRVPQA
ncbi:MAG: response regulator [Sphingomonadales bacterium]|nr:response regulator [Sphingomonadales bacterium]